MTHKLQAARLHAPKLGRPRRWPLGFGSWRREAGAAVAPSSEGVGSRSRSMQGSQALLSPVASPSASRSGRGLHFPRLLRHAAGARRHAPVNEVLLRRLHPGCRSTSRPSRLVALALVLRRGGVAPACWPGGSGGGSRLPWSASSSGARRCTWLLGTGRASRARAARQVGWLPSLPALPGPPSGLCSLGLGGGVRPLVLGLLPALSGRLAGCAALPLPGLGLPPLEVPCRSMGFLCTRV